jgi:hypothetical protein
MKNEGINKIRNTKLGYKVNPSKENFTIEDPNGIVNNHNKNKLEINLSEYILTKKLLIISIF